MTMTWNDMAALAQFFTSGEVARHSIALQMPNARAYGTAELFFKARNALGIEGYDDTGTAMEKLRKLFPDVPVGPSGQGLANAASKE